MGFYLGGKIVYVNYLGLSLPLIEGVIFMNKKKINYDKRRI